MKDRFKFRCWITISHYDDNDNDIETLLLVDNISIYDSGEVGFDGYSLEEAVKRANLSKEEERTLWNSLKEYEVFEEWYQMPADLIEQCTGLKDKNGKLIYEGDIVKTHLKRKGRVLWNEICWCYRTLDNARCTYIMESYDIEVIGNIHQPEALK